MALVEQFEGLDLKAYTDSVGVWTIAWGRILYDDGSRVKMGDTCTRAQADQWLIEDLERDGCQYVRKYFPSLNDDQYAALSSFTFNRGSGRLHQLVMMSADLESIAANLLHFDYAGSDTNHLLGLKRRRLAEQALFRSLPWRVFVSWKP
jgi:lysozyme